MEHLKNILDGMRQVLILDTGSQYIRPSRNGFIRTHQCCAEMLSA